MYRKQFLSGIAGMAFVVAALTLPAVAQANDRGYDGDDYRHEHNDGHDHDRYCPPRQYYRPYYRENYDNRYRGYPHYQRYYYPSHRDYDDSRFEIIYSR